MTYPTIQALPTAPQRNQDPEDFTTTADTFVAALPTMVSEINTSTAYIDNKAISVGNDFQGAYSAGTTYTLGQSVLYSEVYYISLVNDNTGNTPDSSPSDWSEIVTGGGGGSAGSVDFVASGAISNGDVVVLNSDGTVSVGVATSAGTPTVFESGIVSFTAAVYDPNSNKVVIAYMDDSNSDYGTAIVGTVSGTSISFGTPVVYNSASSPSTVITFDSNSNKVVIAYRDFGNSQYGTAIVGTVSGTSISFGTPAVFESAILDYISATFDSNSNKVVISYRDNGNSEYGTAVVGTVSGTSISFGTPVVFRSSTIAFISSTFDTNSNKVIISYRDGGNSNYGTAIVGTVSGTSISFGTAVVFDSQLIVYSSPTFDASNNKVVIAYERNSGNKGTAIVGTVSGTSISFGTAVEFANNLTNFVSASYNSSQNSVAIFYSDDDNAERGTILAGTVSGTSISFGPPTVVELGRTRYGTVAFDTSAEKLVLAYKDVDNGEFGTAATFTFGNDGNGAIGLATQDMSDGAGASITTIGGVNESQSGLSIGSAYYLSASTDGGLTTSAEEGPKVGRAIAADKILVTEG